MLVFIHYKFSISFRLFKHFSMHFDSLKPFKRIRVIEDNLIHLIFIYSDFRKVFYSNRQENIVISVILAFLLE